MKLSLTIHDKTYSVESNEGYDHGNIDEISEQFKGLLVNAGFHPSNVDELFNTEYRWFTQEERDQNMQGHIKYNYTDPDHPMYLAQEEEFAQEEEYMKKYNEGYTKGWAEAKHQDKVQKFQDNLYKNEEDMFN